MKPGLLLKLRIACLLVAGWLILGGCHSTLHPRLVAKVSHAVATHTAPPHAYPVVDLRTSTASRCLGVLRVFLGSAMVYGVVLTFRPGWPRRT